MTPGDRRALKTIAVLVVIGGFARWRGPVLTVSPNTEHVVSQVERSDRDSLLSQSIRMSTPLARGETVDISTSSSREIDRLPGIGPALARRIVAYRTENGPFRSIDDLRKVPGIGATLSAGLAPHLKFRSSPGRNRTSPAAPQTVDVNTATPQELIKLPGIGPGRAAAIIAYREAHGPFKTVGDLTLVSGIGPATVAGLEGLVRLP